MRRSLRPKEIPSRGGAGVGRLWLRGFPEEFSAFFYLCVRACLLHIREETERWSLFRPLTCLFRFCHSIKSSSQLFANAKSFPNESSGIPFPPGDALVVCGDVIACRTHHRTICNNCIVILRTNCSRLSQHQKTRYRLPTNLSRCTFVKFYGICEPRIGKDSLIRFGWPGTLSLRVHRTTKGMHWNMTLCNSIQFQRNPVSFLYT